ncbi:hypothetical protein H0E82_03150 [Luteimonas sp. SJ-16]|uniref:Uncharacterized protein n=2 Tax=Luteimonas deserti TaxID=2752306 RepID=A0A7Z0TZ17_9GAMM|nr:hypothetical protein [Luteimonas deserti]
MAALLRQGRRADAISAGLAALAALWLLAASLHTMATPVAVLLAASLALYLWQAYCATRTALDAELLQALATTPAGDDPAATLDASLCALGLQAADRGGRDWAARWRGARGWLRRQLVATAGQAVLLGLAGGWAVVHGGTG